MPEAVHTPNRRRKGIILLASAFLLGFSAMLIGLGVVGFWGDLRVIVAVVFGALSVAEALIGLRLLLGPPQ